MEENVPLGDALLVATALEHKIPIIVFNDRHVRKLTEEYRLIYENSHTTRYRKTIVTYSNT